MNDVKSQAKADRLKAALKENLKRRKAQARSRQATKASAPQNGPDAGSERDKPSD
jgi:UDP:flavonoid glycosyltransferase YjiC (YdhE family)